MAAGITFVARPGDGSGEPKWSPPKPSALQDSYLRPGYPKTPTNPHGYHWATDIPCPTNTIIQLPGRAKLTRKGSDLKPSGAGYYMEWQIIEPGNQWNTRYVRFFHMAGPCSFKIGTIKPRGYAVGRANSTGHANGPHIHVEVGRYPWKQTRDPRYNPWKYLVDALKRKDY